MPVYRRTGEVKKNFTRHKILASAGKRDYAKQTRRENRMLCNEWQKPKHQDQDRPTK